MKVAPIIQEAEEGFASNMVQKLRLRFATMKDVPTKLSATMFVWGMEQSERRSICADIKDVPTNVLVEEFVSDMGLQNTFAVMKDVQLRFLWEDCASDMGQRDILAAMMDVPTKLLMEEFV